MGKKHRSYASNPPAVSTALGKPGYVPQEIPHPPGSSFNSHPPPSSGYWPQLLCWTLLQTQRSVFGTTPVFSPQIILRCFLLQCTAWFTSSFSRKSDQPLASVRIIWYNPS